MVILSFVDSHFDGKYSVDVSTQGHGFLTLVVAFLLVSRVNTGLTRYESARDSIGVMYRECRELVQNVCVFTGKNQDDLSKEWRQEVTYRCVMLLKTSMAVIDYPTDQIPV
jgi:predicted membrane chloride channel (bestrophin family)